MHYFPIFAEMLSWPSVLSVLSCLICYPGDIVGNLKMAPMSWMSPPGKAVINQTSLCTPSSLIGLFWNCLTSERIVWARKNIQIVNEAMAQAERVSDWKPKKNSKQAKRETHPLFLQSLSSHCSFCWFSLTRQWVEQELGLVHGGIFVSLFTALVAVSQEGCVMVCCTQVCAVRFHRRRGSNTREVVS